MKIVIDHSQLLKILDGKIQESSTHAVGKDLGFSQVYIWQVWNGKKKVSEKLAQKLGFKPILGTFKKL